MTNPNSHSSTQPAPGAAGAPGGAGGGRPHPQFLCPYCGHVSANAQRCDHCKGLFEPLSRQATQNAMGPWQVRSAENPFQPGCSYATLASLIAKKKVGRNTILRGPTTRQFWSFASNAPGVAVLLGECHSCHHAVKPDGYMCPSCNAVLSPPTDRQHLGLAPVKLLPGQAPPEAVASSSMGGSGASRPAHAAPSGTTAAAAATRVASHAPGARVAHAPAPVRGATQPAPPSPHSRETTRRLRDRLRFMTGAFIFAIVMNVAMLVIFAVVMLAGSDTLSIGGGGGDGGGGRAPGESRSSGVQGTPTGSPAENGATGTGEPDRDDPRAGQRPDATPASNEREAARPDEPAESAPSAPTPSHDLDAGLDPWAPDINQASELERRDTVEALERAVAILERVHSEARAAAIADGADDPAFPLLRARIERLTERLDRLSLRDMFE